MKLSVHPYFLEFFRPFALAHGTRTGTQLAFVKIEHEGITAYGEASLPPYLTETFDSVKNWVEAHFETVSKIITADPFKKKEEIPFSSENPSASAALQSAILNWHVLKTGKSLSDHFEKKNSHPALTITITKNDYDFLEEKLILAKHFTHLKLKLTAEIDDLDFVKAIRNKTDMPFCIDINQGFRKKEEAIRLIEKLEDNHCVLVEQPLKDFDHDGHYWLKQRLETPIIADESIRQYEDLVQFHEAYSGVNIKLMKCGGLFQAQEMLNYNIADGNFIKLIGCMSESTLGVATASVLASQCDMADLDAPYLNKNDPFEGFQIVNGKIQLEDRIVLKDNSLFK